MAKTTGASVTGYASDLAQHGWMDSTLTRYNYACSEM